MIDNVYAIERIRVALGPSESMNGAGAQVSVVITPAAGPVCEDQTLEEDGINVFVDPDIAPLREDKLLDLASVGADQARFTLTERWQP